MFNKISVQALLAAVVLMTASNAPAAFVRVTDGEQYIGGGIGYTSDGVDYRYIDQTIPDPPQRAGDADLNLSLAQYGVSVSWSLSSVFGEDHFRATGSGSASCDWDDHPSDADDVHGGGGSRFAVDLSAGSSPTYLQMKGEIAIVIDGSVGVYPEETLVYVKLSSKSGTTLTKIWEIKLDGRDTRASMPVDHGVWLDANQNYVLEARAEAGTMAAPEHSAWNSRTARFSLTAAFSDSDVSDIYFLKDYVPLEEGITWNYLQTYDNGEKNYEVFCIGGTELVNGVVTHKEWEFDSGELLDSQYYNYNCMAWTKEGLKIYKNVSSDGSYVTCSPPSIVLPALIRVGETFRHSCTFTERNFWGGYVDSWPYSVEIVLEGAEDITVMAGKFEQCLKFSGTEEDEGEMERFTIWYAPGIGEVRRLFPGSEDRELMSYTSRGKTLVPE